MKRALAFLCLLLAGCASQQPPSRQVTVPKELPVVLDKNFSFRKTKQFFLDPAPKGGAVRNLDASISFEKTYRVYGAITAVDARQRYGNYYDFFWRARRRADVTVRFEYQQEKLHAFVQTREIRYPQARGHLRSEFAIIGDDFFDDGRVIAWRASLIVDGKIAAKTQSYLWN